MSGSMNVTFSRRRYVSVFLAVCVSSTDGLSTSTIHDNQPAIKQVIVTEWGKLSQRFTDRAIGQWRRRLACVLQQQGEHIEHLIKNCSMRVTFDNNRVNKHVVSC